MQFFSSLQNYVLLLVLIFCVEFQELSHLRRAQSEAEKKMLLQAEQMHKTTTISLKMVEVVILSVAQLVSTGFFLLLSLR